MTDFTGSSHNPSQIKDETTEMKPCNEGKACLVKKIATGQGNKLTIKKAFKTASHTGEIPSKTSKAIKKGSSSLTLANQAAPEAAAPLKLMVSNPGSLPEETPSQPAGSTDLAPFKADVIAHGPGLYTLRVEDASHFLKCELPLELKQPGELKHVWNSNKAKKGNDSNTVVCRFPPVEDEALSAFIGDDETLYGILIVQFQIKIMERLLSFCAEHDAASLVILMDGSQADAFEVYENIILSTEKPQTPAGKKVKWLIPADIAAYRRWAELKERAAVGFKQTLWHDQRYNFEIRKYLKSRSLADF